jgi:hypothetical protein
MDAGTRSLLTNPSRKQRMRHETPVNTSPVRVVHQKCQQLPAGIEDRKLENGKK